MTDDAYASMASQEQEARLLQVLDERLTAISRERRSYWQQWLQPQTVIALMVALGTVYGSSVLQVERIEVMRTRLDAIERDYQRRDVLAERLQSIDNRLSAIEQAVQTDELRHLGGKERQ